MDQLKHEPEPDNATIPEKGQESILNTSTVPLDTNDINIVPTDSINQQTEPVFLTVYACNWNQDGLGHIRYSL